MFKRQVEPAGALSRRRRVAAGSGKGLCQPPREGDWCSFLSVSVGNQDPIVALDWKTGGDAAPENKKAPAWVKPVLLNFFLQ